MKATDLPAPLAWRLSAADLERHTDRGRQHCEHRGCRKPITTVTWRKFFSKAAGRDLLSERFMCDEHAAKFAERHHIRVEDAPRGGR